MPALIAWAVALPRWAKIAALVAVAALALLTVHKCAVNDAVRADRAKQAAKVEKTARAADEASRGAVDTKRNEVDNANDEARRAAADSDDKLKAGLDALRQRSSE